MNIDFRNRTIFAKILSGFILLLLLAALMGGVLFYSLRDVTGVLRRITERNAPSIRYPTGVERYALRTILDEKNYLLLQKKEIHEQAMHDIREIYANLDRVDQVATKYNDQALLRKSKDVRRVVEEYQEYYNRGVALLEENQQLAHKMRVLGRRVNDLSHTHTLDHKRLLEEAIANGIDQTKYMKGFHLCNQFENEALEARRQEKNYILYKKQEYFDALREHITNLNRLYDEITKVAYVFEHESLMAETRKATDEYFAAAEKWVANDNELSEILTEMHEIGVKVQQTAMAVQEAGWQEMDTSKEAALQTTEMASLTGILVAAFTIIIGIVLAFFIARGIAGPIKGLSLATAGIARGDLSRRVAVKGGDEAGQLAISFNTMVENLQNTMVSRDYLNSIIRSMIDLLIVVDAEAKIEMVNPATCDVSGYTEEELIGQPINIIFAEEEEEEESFFKGTGLSRLMREGEVRNMELTILSKSGERIPLVFNGSVIRGEDGTLATVVGVARDMRETMRLIAELRESEEALRRFSEKLEQRVEKRTRELRQTQAQLIQAGKLAALGQLAGGVAHEINNPLSGVLGFSINLLKAADNEELKKVEAFRDFPESLELIKVSALRCRDITEKLLSFARERKHEFRPTDINRAIEDVLSLVGHQIKIRKVAVKKDLEARLPLPMADPNQLQQVFLNMILNAADAMPDGGELTIATGVREAETRSVEVTFTDTGEGIAPENMDKLFEPFFTTKPPGKGTGLGLSLSYGIIKEHGGTIEVESEVGRGSRFKVILNIEN